jgi:hypothetical protein
MKNLTNLGAIAATAIAGIIFASPAQAQVSRTWVSGTGLDTNPCSRTQPCLTFATALAATAAGGEINVLDPGGFGNVTINKSVSIYNDGAGEAGIVVSGVNAIVINAAATDVINLRGLVLNGQGGNLGVHVLSAGSVSIEKCVIQQFGTGVNVATSTNIKLKIQDATIINNTNGVSIQPGGGVANVAIERSRMDSNSGLGVLGNGAFGGTTFLSVADSSASLNGIHGIVGRSGSGYALVTVSRSNIVGNAQFGILADGSTGSSKTEMVVGNSLITDNFGGAAQALGNASLFSNLNNEILFFGPAAFQSFPLR